MKLHDSFAIDSMPLRKCNHCGLEAWSEEDLSLFKTDNNSKYGVQNTCKKCYNKWQNSKKNLSYFNRIFEPLRVCRVCGLEAGDFQQLNSFRKHSGLPYNRETICKSCYREETHRKLWIEALETLSEHLSCFNCSKDDIRILSIDHIHGNGNKERNTERLYKKIIKLGREEALKEYQILCRNCNWEKHIVLSGKKPCSAVRLKALLNISNPPYCVECEETNLTYLSVDHINNDGYNEYSNDRHVKQYRKISKMNKERVKKNYQILCRNCNWIKRREFRNER